MGVPKDKFKEIPAAFQKAYGGVKTGIYSIAGMEILLSLIIYLDLLYSITPVTPAWLLALTDIKSSDCCADTLLNL